MRKRQKKYWHNLERMEKNERERNWDIALDEGVLEYAK